MKSFLDFHQSLDHLSGLSFPTFRSSSMVQSYIEDGAKAGLFVCVNIGQDIDFYCTPDYCDAQTIPFDVHYPASEGEILEPWVDCKDAVWTGDLKADIALFKSIVGEHILRLTAAMFVSDLDDPDSAFQTGHLLYTYVKGDLAVFTGQTIEAHGGVFHQAKLLEGHKQNSLVLIADSLRFTTNPREAQ